MEQNNVQTKIFSHPTFGKIRTEGDAENPMFCLTDLCRCLDLRVNKVVQRLSDDVLSKYPISDRLGRQQMTNFVNEDGLYDVILESRKPEAKAFRKWVTSEVLPSIRRHGAYATDYTIENIIQNPDFGITLLSALKRERTARCKAEEGQLRLANKMEELRPMVSYCAQVLASTQTVTVTQIAQDYGYSARAFNELLRDMGVQYRLNEQWILYAELKANGYVQSCTAVYTRFDGSQGSKMYTRWTQNGRLYLYHRLKGVGILPLIEKGN
jgi:anti-repressor protein